MYRDQSAADLRLHVVEGEIDTRHFSVFESTTRTVGRIRVEAGIIGASHFVECVQAVGIEGTRRRALTEVFACEAVADKHLVYAADLAALPRPLSLRLDSGVAYRFEHRVTNIDSSARELDDLRSKIKTASGADTLGLSRAFPGVAGQAAETLVWVRVGADGPSSSHSHSISLSIETAHCYPNEAAVVLSRSAIVLARAGPPIGVR